MVQLVVGKDSPGGWFEAVLNDLASAALMGSQPKAGPITIFALYELFDSI
jgi:hypothetical protein